MRRHRKHIEDDRLLDVNEAAAILSVSPKTLYDWAYERRLPVVKLFGKALRFRSSVIQELIDGSERPALSDPVWPIRNEYRA